MADSNAFALLRDGLGRVVAQRSNLLTYWSSIGAICESSRWLAQRMRNAINDPSLPIVELGAGYGSVTSVLPETAISIERDVKRYAHLKSTFPERTILGTCAIQVLAQLTQPTVVISSIPSVNNPEFDRLRAAIVRAQKAGVLTQLITYSYFPHDPFAGLFPNSKMVGYEILNIPPAFVWSYSC